MDAKFRRLMPLLVCALPAFSGAEENTAASGKTAPEQHTVSRFRDPEDGQFDVSNFLEHPRAFLPVPVIVTEPAVGYGGGLVGMFVRPREEAGREGFARPNISAAGGIATENGTWAAFGADSSHWKRDRLQTLAAAGAGEIHLDFYGLGNNTASLDQPVSYTLDFALAMMQGNWKLKDQSPWSAGLRYIYSQVEPSLDGDPLIPGLIDHIDMEISAPGAVLEYDSRNNLFTPTRGIYSESFYMHSLEDLGATEEFERFQQVIMGWLALGDAVTLGLRGDYQWSSDGTPFFLRPYIKLRGVEAMRYQGDEMASAEVEARWKVHGRWSLVGAAGYGTARTENDFFSSSSDVWSGAVGFRYELARKFGMHAGLDVGVSEGTTAVYIQVGNAWFRP